MFLELMSGGKKGGVQCKETGCGGEGQAHLQENMGNGGVGSQRVPFGGSICLWVWSSD